MDDLTRGLHEAERIGGGAQLKNYRVENPKILRVRDIHNRRNFPLKRVISDCPGDASNLELVEFSAISAEPDPLADGILSLEVLPREYFVDHCNQRRAGRVALANLTAGHQANLHGCE